VDQIAPFGATLHVVGKDRRKLEGTLRPIETRNGYSVTPGTTSLEDVFIQFMAGARDNMQ
jgi:ABC-2 type transport system ATP-binding protein